VCTKGILLFIFKGEHLLNGQSVMKDITLLFIKQIKETDLQQTVIEINI